MILELRNLDTLHLRGISLRIQDGCFTLSGPSGCGKSLLLRALADLDPHTGEILLDELPQRATPAPLWRRRVAYLPADSHWWADRVGRHFSAIDPVLLNTLGFGAEVMDWDLARLSSGERQRLALARALALKPRVLLLDEPTANLDRASTGKVETLLLEYLSEPGRMALWVSHDLEQLTRVGTRHFRILDDALIEDRA